MMEIWFDMDGTIADLYKVENWLEMLRKFDSTPYLMAQPMLNMSLLARALNRLKEKGFRLGIVSWCSKCSTDEYDAQVAKAKKQWLKRHLPSVQWDNIIIAPYGKNKFNLCEKQGILFDDEEKNRQDWKNGLAFPPSEIKKILKLVLESF